MQVILMGPPGSGKGTQADVLSKKLGLPHLSTGNMLRREIAEKTPLGFKVEEIMGKGLLVPDDVVLEILAKKLASPECSQGYLLDGFPRNVAQAEMLDALLAKTRKKIDAVVNLEVTRDEVVRRLSGRRTCMACGTVTHVSTTASNACFKCGGQLIQRQDDSIESVTTRLDVYEKQTKPLIQYYAQRKLLKNVTAMGTPQEITLRVLSALGLSF